MLACRLAWNRDRHLRVDVVVDLDVVLALMRAQQPTHVPYDPALPRQWEREEKRVERGTFEPFAEGRRPR